jgi:aminoglycoside 6'-N-acetyltransferase
MRRTMATFQVRPATEADATEIADQYAGLHVDQWANGGGPPGSDHEADWLAEVRESLAASHIRVLVAEAEGGPVGTARVEFGERPYFRIADIRRVYVQPAWRRQGIATELMRVAEETARQGGAKEVRLTVIAENAAAIAFYRRLGYGDFAIRLRKHLS